MQHACSYLSLPLLHDCDVKLPNFTFCVWRTIFSFSELGYSSWYSPLEFNSRKSRQHLTNWTRWNNKFAIARSHLLKGRFRSRIRGRRQRWKRRFTKINSRSFIFIAIIPTQFLSQTQTSSSGVEFLENHVQVQKEKKNFVVACLRPPLNGN